MYRPDWSAEENRRHFGSVADYHGHEYECRVTVTGSPDPATGMIADLAELDRILQLEILERLSGKQLNTEVPELSSGRPLPTCEALATILYSRIASRLPSGLGLMRIRVAEDATLYAERSGDP
jgi:6-pyruvoyltetrahydropterin/6-carboxytetrahydropterin synthase